MFTVSEKLYNLDIINQVCLFEMFDDRDYGKWIYSLKFLVSFNQPLVGSARLRRTRVWLRLTILSVK